MPFLPLPAFQFPSSWSVAGFKKTFVAAFRSEAHTRPAMEPFPQMGIWRFIF